MSPRSKARRIRGDDGDRSEGLPRRACLDGAPHGLEPVVPLDPRSIRSVDDLVRSMGRASFGARQVGEAADLLAHMARDRGCLVVCTLSGAMTVAKMGGVLVEMIERGLVHVIVSTGALMTHGLVESGGMTHFKWREDLDDAALFEAGYNRVYDTLELERNLDDVGALLESVLREHDPGETLSSRSICRMLARGLLRRGHRRGILQAAFRRRVPVFIPAFTDCELGLDFALLNHRRRARGEPVLRFDPFLDLDDYAEVVRRSDRLGIFTVGGGVPRNWAQQVGPYLDLLDRSLHGRDQGFRPFSYGIRICPDPPQWGHLSGCTYSEGVSWGKFLPPQRGGRWVEVLADATIAWPLIVQAVIERLDARNPRPAEPSASAGRPRRSPPPVARAAKGASRSRPAASPPRGGRRASPGPRPSGRSTARESPGRGGD